MFTGMGLWRLRWGLSKGWAAIGRAAFRARRIPGAMALREFAAEQANRHFGLWYLGRRTALRGAVR